MARLTKAELEQQIKDLQLEINCYKDTIEQLKTSDKNKELHKMNKRTIDTLKDENKEDDKW